MTVAPAAPGCSIPSTRFVDPDRDLVEQALAGRTAAFGTLVERHGDVVFRVAARIVGPDQADDVSQDAFLRAFHRLDRFRGESPFRSWLLQITHNTAMNAVSRRVPEPAGDGPATEERERDALPVREPATRLEDRERRERLQRKLALLRPEHRSVLVLRDLEGLAYAEIAEVCEMPLGSVKGRIHRARSELIGLLRANTYDWELPE